MNALPQSPFTASLEQIHPGGPAAESSADRLRTTFAAVIFDMDGVVTDTAAVHASAWKSLFDALLADERLQALESDGTIDRREFDISRDYRDFVDGRRREDGIRTLLASRGAFLPEGSDDEAPARGPSRARPR